MKDFLNYEILVEPIDKETVRYLMRHKKKEGLQVEMAVGGVLLAQDLPTYFTMLLKAWAQEYAKKTRKRLTAGQKAFYDHLVKFCKEQGRPPSYDEQRDFLGVLSKGTAYYYTNKLVQSGWVWRDENGLAIPMDIQTPDLV